VSVEPARANETAEAFVPKAEFTHYERDALVAQVFGDAFEMLSVGLRAVCMAFEPHRSCYKKR